MASTITVTREPTRAPTPQVAPNAQCPSCGSARFSTRLRDGSVLVACAGCDATYESVLELVTRHAERRSRARAWWMMAAGAACAAVVGVLAFT